jgi:hypothetical protein
VVTIGAGGVVGAVVVDLGAFVDGGVGVDAAAVGVWAATGAAWTAGVVAEAVGSVAEGKLLSADGVVAVTAAAVLAWVAPPAPHAPTAIDMAAMRPIPAAARNIDL